MADADGITTVPLQSQNAHIAAHSTGQPNIRADQKHEGVGSQAKDALTGRRNVKQIEHAQINDAIAQGIAANVDDFMVQIPNRHSQSTTNADAPRHSSKKQTKPTNASAA